MGQSRQEMTPEVWPREATRGAEGFPSRWKPQPRGTRREDGSPQGQWNPMGQDHRPPHVRLSPSSQQTSVQQKERELQTPRCAPQCTGPGHTHTTGDQRQDRACLLQQLKTTPNRPEGSSRFSLADFRKQRRQERTLQTHLHPLHSPLSGVRPATQLPVDHHSTSADPQYVTCGFQCSLLRWSFCHNCL